jgi:trans-2,3-dihydro-3-hydroxyanthranilate isomerase
MMNKLHYHLVDVFTDRAFGGNPLAVFTDGAGVSDELMQSIAKELNLSETTFVLPPGEQTNDFRIRIFTPTSELPMAGHPTIGTAFVLAHQGLTKKREIVFEEGVGPVSVSIQLKNGAAAFIEMRQPLPEFGQQYQDVDRIAEMLSVRKESVSKLPVQVVSCGVPFLFVPISDLHAVRRLRLRLDVWEEVVRDCLAKDIFVFTKEVQFPGSHVHSRMFAPAHGIVEDPATGGASGPLGCYLVRHQLFPSDGELRVVSEQGIEMGRPSFVKIRIKHRGHDITDVRVGGTCHHMGNGCLF